MPFITVSSLMNLKEKDLGIKSAEMLDIDLDHFYVIDMTIERSVKDYGTFGTFV